jgi:hypothetical protein
VDDAGDVVHLARAAHRAAVALADAADLVAEVEVRVDLDEVQRAVARNELMHHHTRWLIPRG